MKAVKILLALGIITTSYQALAQNEDEYDYILAPQSEQVADLLDDDSDGVINARDKCPGTAVGSEINNDGCGERIDSSEEMQVKVLFANDSDEINPIFQQQIMQLSDFLKEYPDTSIELKGYASKTGSASHNLELSKRRAQNVEKALLNYGIDSDRVKIVGFGDTHLATDGTDEVSHALNRRVTASVIGYKGEIKKEWTIFTTLPKS